MVCHGNVTRDRCVTVTCDSRVASQGVSQCPDPTRPDPTHSCGYVQDQVQSVRAFAIGLGS
jgi:hypothetical protein